MPIKIKKKIKDKNQNKKNKLNLKKIQNKRILIPKKIKLAAIGLIALLVLFSTVNAYILSQEPSTKTKTNVLLAYSQNGNYNYKAYLKNNTIYEGKEYLSPNQGILFRKLINNINGSFSYTFQISNNSDISGKYSFTALIKTSQWTKTYHLVQTSTFNVNNTRSYTFTENFPIDYIYYEQIITQINNETGVTAQNPVLIIKCNLQLTADTVKERITQSFNPSIEVSLRKDTIDISENLSLRTSGSETEQETVKQQENTKEKNKWTILAISFLVIGIVILLVTTTEKIQLSKLEKKFRNIKKKYKEYIIELKKPLITDNIDLIYVKTMEDLIRLSEEMGKPIFVYDNSKDSTDKYEFFVLEEYTYYVFSLK